MSTIVTRAGKGSPLTNTELDSNFTNLNTDKAELSGATFTGNLNLGDNVKATFGAGNDLQIYHDGSDSFIDDAGTGALAIRASTGIILGKYTGETMASFIQDGAVTLNYDNAAKLATTSTGIDVTGSVVADGLRVDTSATGGFKVEDRGSSGTKITSYQGTNNSNVRQLDLNAYKVAIRTGEVTGTAVTDRVLVSNNGDISFYNDSAAQGLFWDSSTSRLGLGVTNSASLLHISGANGSGRLELQNTWGTTVTNWRIAPVISGVSNNGFEIRDVTQGVSRFVINSSGNATFSGSVGIGTSLPTSYADTTLHVSGSTGSTLKLSSDAQGNANTDGFDISHSGVTAFINNRENGDMQFRTNNVEAMRIDGSQNVLISTTDTAVGAGDTNTGISLQAAGRGFFSIASDYAGRFNRNTSDGDLVTFAKDGTTVGSIGTQGGDLNIGTGACGIQFVDGVPALYPWTTTGNTTRDAAIDLGDSGARFKDLYLSGSVNGGGTYRAGNTGTGNIILEGGQHIFRFGSGGSYAERARIDTSGSLLVGKTSSGIANSGFEVGQSGQINVTQAGAVVARFNRKTSDGSILELTKDGSTVGSIGIESSGFYLDGEASHAGLKMFAGAIGSRQNGSDVDATIDLGWSGGRFKDLYLSNKVYANYIGSFGDTNTNIYFPTGDQIRFITGGNERARIDSSGQVKIHTPITNDFFGLSLQYNNTDTADFKVNQATGQIKSGGSATGYYPTFWSNNTERTRTASNGTLYHGKTADPLNTGGLQTLISGQTSITQSYTEPLRLNRMSTEGAIQKFYYNGGEVGSVGTTLGGLYIADAGVGFRFDSGGTDDIIPCNATGAAADASMNLGSSGARFKDLFLSGSVNIGDAKTVGHGAISLKYDLVYMTAGVISPADDDGSDNDNSVDLGKSAARFNDIFATNGTIQTSDRNEKQDIESLTEAEERVAVAAKGLLKKFRWKSAVEDKGDDARIHFGIIAQDLQAAFEAEGLDAGRYGMFTSNTWTNEDGEEQTRMGVRYSELLAFIISAI